MPTFTMSIEKMKAGDVGRAKGHNCRTHPTSSQLPKAAWFSSPGRHEVVPWNDGAIERARGLSKRKDAVVAISMIFQLGNQTDWRDAPTAQCPEGRPRMGLLPHMNSLCRGVREWAEKEFGADNIVSVEIHTDESTPHLHLIVTPVHQGKLQAKQWCNGAASLAQLRHRAWSAVNQHIECHYKPGGDGGKPHDPAKAAGATPVPTVIDKMTGHAKARELEREKAALQAENEQLKQVLFSRDKHRYFALRAEEAEAALAAAAAAQAAQRAAEQREREADKIAQELARRVEKQGVEIERLKGANERLADENNGLLDELREYRHEQP